jgi:hypothetical protein
MNHRSYDPQTVTLLKCALEAAWAQIPPTARMQGDKSLLGERILKAAANGERDLARLQAAGLHRPRSELRASS